jgi:SPP1 family predicted phage head-tail adaptor
MKIGDYNRRVEVQTDTTPTLKDDLGGKIYTWSTTSEIWAKVTNLTGGKLEAARQIDIQASVEIGTRFCGTGGVAGITVANQLVYNGRTLEIVHVNDVFEQHTELRITCKEQISV